MTAQNSETFRQVVRKLHNAKNAAYRNAWKRRGEMMSIMANVARKVDRLEFAGDDAPSVHDESVLDTAIDLFVYVVKYHTYLADQDETIAAALYGDVPSITSPFSDGPEGFDYLLSVADLRVLDDGDGPSVGDSSASVVKVFAELEACFAHSPAPITRRAELSEKLKNSALVLIAALKRQDPKSFDHMLSTYANGRA